MEEKFNPFASKVLLSSPHRLTSYSFWQEHIPFGMWLVEALRPRVLVELGTHHGDSYCAFCQAVQELGLPAHCFAVDSWQGDIHVGDYGQEVLTDLRRHHDPRYAGFSTLMRCDFDAACLQFADGAIDLLHIDGTHTYEAVKHDFELWLPKMSQRGVVLLHDTNVLDRGFGVRQFFDEVKAGYGHFEFLHGYGLGVLLVGEEAADRLAWLATADGVTTWKLRRYFYLQGRRITLQLEERQRLEHQLMTAQRELEVLQRQLAEIVNSRGWQLLQRLWSVKRFFMSGSRKAAVIAPATIPAVPALQAQISSEAQSPVPAGDSLVVAEASEVNQSSVLEVSGRAAAANLLVRGDSITLTSADVRLLAFFLPQFHPIPENDRWWGKGFTEWTYVARAKPNFAGHYQPHLPADLGFYDLRLPETREQQAELARQYGLHGFCYYHYWFGGKRLLERPFEEVLKSGRPDFPFCLCWANENWTRRWDGLEQEVLLAQQYSPEDDRNFIISLFPAFNDERYVRVNGKPLLLVYRAGRLPNPAQTVELWRSECRRAGLGELYLCALDYFTDDLWAYGFDSAVEFPPHGLAGENLLPQVSKSNPNYHGVIVDYVQTAQTMIERPVTENVLFRGVMPGWDNTARRQDDSLIFLNSSPQAYEAWLRKAIELTLTRYRGDERIVFINAWNEWAEGAHLEPDCRYGLQYLEATRNALTVDTRLAKLVQR